MAPLEKVEGHLWECGGCRLPFSSCSCGEQAVKGLEVSEASLVEQRLGPPLKVGMGPPL